MCVVGLVWTVVVATAGTGDMMRAGMAQDGVMKIVDVPRPIPGPKELLVRVQATAVNRADTLQRRGLYDPPPGVTAVLGLEAAGVVEAVGSECNAGFAHGDKVMVLVSGGGYAEFLTVDERHAIAVPSGMSIIDAAAIPEVWLTAYQLLHFVVKIQPGDTVLIHAGGSGVGTAATQLALLHGAASVMITAGSDAKREHSLKLGASHAFNRGDGWADQVLEATGGRGVDVVLDCVGGSYWQQNVKALAMDGRWAVYGLMGGSDVNGPILAGILRKRLSVVGTTLRSRSNDYKAELVAAFTKTAAPLFSSVQGAPPRLKPIIDSVLAFDQVQDAHVAMEANSNNGKIVLVVDPTVATSAGEVESRSDL